MSCHVHDLGSRVLRAGLSEVQNARHIEIDQFDVLKNPIDPSIGEFDH